jgi:hypothetical protein
MFDAPYRFVKAAKKSDLSLPHLVSNTIYRFKARKRHYLVFIQLYNNNLFAVKFCDRHHKEDRTAYTHIYNDFDAFKIITTCLYIIQDFLNANPQASFGYYAVPRKESNYKQPLDALWKRKISKNFSKARYNIYQYMMVNKFPPSLYCTIL